MYEFQFYGLLQLFLKSSGQDSNDSLKRAVCDRVSPTDNKKLPELAKWRGLAPLSPSCPWQSSKTSSSWKSSKYAQIKNWLWWSSVFSDDGCLPWISIQDTRAMDKSLIAMEGDFGWMEDVWYTDKS